MGTWLQGAVKQSSEQRGQVTGCHFFLFDLESLQALRFPVEAQNVMKQTVYTLCVLYEFLTHREFERTKMIALSH